jgi:type IV pilus assembly protein PilE
VIVADTGAMSDREAVMLAKKSKGFTLLELMIVVVIIAVLAGLAFNNYGKYGFRARRVDGKDSLTRAASQQERIYTNFNAYASGIVGAASGNPPAGLGWTSALSGDGHYTIDVFGLGGGNQTYTLRATPVVGDPQASDACGVLTIDNTGVKTPAAGVMPQNSNGSCW